MKISDDDLEWVLPKSCPICGRPAGGKMLCCEECWHLAPPDERLAFRTMWRRNPSMPQAWKSKAHKILRIIRIRFALTQPPA